MRVLSWIVVGLVAGILAKLALPGDDPGGILLTMVVGIIGAVVLLLDHRLVSRTF